ncbi:precorrin-3B C(17)-methyltransferase [Rhizosaccharibacter radicis]|uniref:Precorrin-3B C(17)-methyltransferase n=1 Tax=Rhizosaccharibacter radicis TaxID=2782605 RepID=A0ABT1W0C2_9PROT|nr:precorrin-3B C(17)-methyltransferase [Acetobacteraceae bacterium KSS12]
MTAGHLAVIGLGPGDEELLAPLARRMLDDATDLFGYGPYLARVRGAPGAVRHPSDNREELARARAALALAQSGRRVAVVSGGDPGVFAMASAVFEAIEAGPPAWRALPVEIVPGISAVLAAAARLGAPLGGDFCVLSLSDNLKPWPVVTRRLRLAAEAGLVIALYNPVSRARSWQLGAAFELLRQVLPPDTPVALATAAYRQDESLRLHRLRDADPGGADMRTLVIIGSAATRIIDRPDGGSWLYTRRDVPD